MDQAATHSHTVSGGTIGGTGAAPVTGPGSPAPFGAAAIVIDPINIDHHHTVSSQGGGLAHANVQPTIVVNKIVRAC